MDKKDINAFLLEHGICTTCGKAMAVKGRKSCLNCLDKFKVVYERRRAKVKTYYREHIDDCKERNQVRYQQRKKMGLCVMCGKKAIEGKVRCERCRLKANSYNGRRSRGRKCGG